MFHNTRVFAAILGLTFFALPVSAQLDGTNLKKVKKPDTFVIPEGTKKLLEEQFSGKTTEQITSEATITNFSGTVLGQLVSFDATWAVFPMETADGQKMMGICDPNTGERLKDVRESIIFETLQNAYETRRMVSGNARTYTVAAQTIGEGSHSFTRSCIHTVYLSR